MERRFLVPVTVRLHIQDADTDGMEPVDDLVVRAVFPADIQVFVQLRDLIDRGLIGLAADVIGGFGEEVTVFEDHRLIVGIVYNLMVNLRADLFLTHEDGLKPPAIPVKVFFLIHIDSVPGNGIIDGRNKVVRRQSIDGGQDLAPSAEHFGDGDRRRIFGFGCG